MPWQQIGVGQNLQTTRPLWDTDSVTDFVTAFEVRITPSATVTYTAVYGASRLLVSRCVRMYLFFQLAT